MVQCPEQGFAPYIGGILVLQKEGQVSLEMLYTYPSDQYNKGSKSSQKFKLKKVPGKLHNHN